MPGPAQMAEDERVEGRARPAEIPVVTEALQDLRENEATDHDELHTEQRIEY